MDKCKIYKIIIDKLTYKQFVRLVDLTKDLPHTFDARFSAVSKVTSNKLLIKLANEGLSAKLPNTEGE